MTKKELIKMYERFMETGYMYREGLCANIIEVDEKLANQFIFIFRPELSELLEREQSLVFWGYYGNDVKNEQKRYFEFTPLRQTLLLLFINYLDDLK